MAIAIALPGFNDRRRSGTPIFLPEADFIRTTISTSSKNEQNIKVGSQIKFKISVNGTSNPAILRFLFLLFG